MSQTFDVVTTPTPGVLVLTVSLQPDVPAVVMTVMTVTVMMTTVMGRDDRR